jgi:hypothetical protein
MLTYWSPAIPDLIDLDADDITVLTPRELLDQL